MALLLSFLILYTCFVHVSLGAFSCIGEGGAERQWFFIYKPMSTFAYVYFDSNMAVGDKFIQGADLNDEDNSPIRKTLASFPTANEWACWNDQPKDDNRDPDDFPLLVGGGHCKGGLAMSGTQVVHYVHSIPNYPQQPSASQDIETQIPSSAGKYAQTFLCITSTDIVYYKTVQRLNVIMKTFIIKHSPTYPGLGISPDLDVYGGHLRPDDYYPEGEMPCTVQQTSADTPTAFTAFGKYGCITESPAVLVYLVDAWSQYASKANKKLLVGVQFRKRADQLASNDWVQNIFVIKSPEKDVTMYYQNSMDHSKWAMTFPTEDQDEYLVCVGDANRQKTQLKRGGGMVCFESEALWTALLPLVICYFKPGEDDPTCNDLPDYEEGEFSPKEAKAWTQPEMATWKGQVSVVTGDKAACTVKKPPPVYATRGRAAQERNMNGSQKRKTGDSDETKEAMTKKKRGRSRSDR